MKNYGLYTCWTKCWEGLSGNSMGYSIKKMICALFSTATIGLLYLYTNKENFLTVLPMLLAFISSLLIVRAVEKNNLLKNGIKPDPDPKPETNQEQQ